MLQLFAWTCTLSALTSDKAGLKVKLANPSEEKDDTGGPRCPMSWATCLPYQLCALKASQKERALLRMRAWGRKYCLEKDLFQEH